MDPNKPLKVNPTQNSQPGPSPLAEVPEVSQLAPAPAAPQAQSEQPASQPQPPTPAPGPQAGTVPPTQELQGGLASPNPAKAGEGGSGQ